MTESICPICKNPKKTGGAGSITQWIVACQCDSKRISEGNETDLSSLIHLCRTCGKRIGEGRSGSITQFVFRFDTCRCAVPAPLAEALDAAFAQADFNGVAEDAPEDETELEVDRNAFPIDRYRPLEQIGAGASGVVYLACDRLLNKRVAIKILRIRAPELVIQFQEEARATSKLKHRHIVELLDFGVTSGGAPYMVLEFVKGPSLAEAIESVGALSLSDFFSVFKRVCEALAYSHKNGVFHRDIKPENIILTTSPDGAFDVRIIDFGLAKIMSDGQKQIGETGGMSLAGTPTYMGPDQGLGRAYDGRTEIYSLGCVMFESLAGRPPFEGENALEVLAKHAESMPPKLADVSFDSSIESKETRFSPALEDFLGKCLSKEPDKRYQSMDELLEALDKLESNPLAGDSGADNYSRTSQRSKRVRKPVWIGITTLGFIVSVFFISQLKFEKASKEPSVSEQSARADLHYGKTVRPDSSLVEMLKKDRRHLKISSYMSDDDLQELRLFKDAVSIDISNNLATDLATSYINSPRLQILILTNNSVKTMEFVSQMKSLEELNLAGTLIDSASIGRLSGLHNLQVLDVRHTAIGDDALPAIRRLKSLRFLICRSSKITEKAKESLRKDMPGCTIEQGDSIAISAARVRRFQDRNQFETLVPVVQKGISLIEKAQGKDAPLLAFYFSVLGSCSIRKNDLEEAKRYLSRAMDVSRKNGDRVYIIDTLRSRALIADREHDHKAAAVFREQLLKAIEARNGFDK